MNILTASALSSFRDCPRKYYFAYRLKRTPITESKPLKVGTAWHTLLESWWKNEDVAPLDLEPEDAAKLLALFAHYNPPIEKFDVIDVEKNFLVKIENPDLTKPAFRSWRLAGKVDVVVREKSTGDIWIIDHKTTASTIIGWSDYWSALSVDFQMGAYCLAFNARGFIYDVVKKPTIKMCGKDDNNPEKYRKRIEKSIREDREPWYQWREFPKLEDDMTEARSDLWQQTVMVRECVNADRYPRNSNACVGRYGKCQYQSVCTGEADIHDDAMFRNKASQHEELGA